MAADFRAQLPALANKTYFNNPALPNLVTEKRCTGTHLS
jgi:hypothetical protein